ncbi:hypothetical protein [Haloparvum sp. PAK95]|uniref:hypothetical protein n=1 Tax=Haloparvum sp. PAK95 TaxID=3418962 RepID=UPI003D2ED9EB
MVRFPVAVGVVTVGAGSVAASAADRSFRSFEPSMATPVAGEPFGRADGPTRGTGRRTRRCPVEGERP